MWKVFKYDIKGKVQKVSDVSPAGAYEKNIRGVYTNIKSLVNEIKPMGKQYKYCG